MQNYIFSVNCLFLFKGSLYITIVWFKNGATSTGTWNMHPWVDECAILRVLTIWYLMHFGLISATAGVTSLRHWRVVSGPEIQK